jgi:hypothetical protein
VMVFTSTVCTREVAKEGRFSRRYVLSNHYTIIRETTNSVCKGKDALTRNNMRNANTSIFMPLPPITMSLHLLLNLHLDRLNIIIWLDFLPICSDYSISNIRLLHCFFGVPVYVADSFLQERLVEFRDFALNVLCESDAGVYGGFRILETNQCQSSHSYPACNVGSVPEVGVAKLVKVNQAGLTVDHPYSLCGQIGISGGLSYFPDIGYVRRKHAYLTLHLQSSRSS